MSVRDQDAYTSKTLGEKILVYLFKRGDADYAILFIMKELKLLI